MREKVSLVGKYIYQKKYFPPKFEFPAKIFSRQNVFKLVYLIVISLNLNFPPKLGCAEFLSSLLQISKIADPRWQTKLRDPKKSDA